MNGQMNLFLNYSPSLNYIIRVLYLSQTLCCIGIKFIFAKYKVDQFWMEMEIEYTYDTPIQIIAEVCVKRS
jgi:hypothetical protein